MRLRILLAFTCALFLAPCSGQNSILTLYQDATDGSYLEVFANSSSIKVRSPYWHTSLRVRLLDDEDKLFTSWVALENLAYVFTDLPPDTRFWTEYEFRVDGDVKRGKLAIRTLRPVPEGFAHSTSFLVGETARLHISSPSTTVSVRMTPATDASAILARWNFNGIAENFVSRKAASNGTEWPMNAEIEIPQVESGYYFLVFSNDNGSSVFPFVVRPARPGAHKLAVVASTNTWNAYNAWGNASYYANELGGPNLLWSSFERPLGPNVVGSGHLIAGELELIKWLEANGIEYDCYSDQDVDGGRLGASYNTWIFHVHSEYWTVQAGHHLRDHLKRGGKVAFLSGNNVWWKVGYVDDGRRMYKNGYHWNRDDASVTGTLYTTAGYGTHAPYSVIEPDHWVFEGTGLRKGDLFGEDGKFGAASGHETDKIVSAKETITLLARGTNAGNGGAEMIVMKGYAGEIFNTSSITFSGTLMGDAASSQILRNVIRRFNGQ